MDLGFARLDATTATPMPVSPDYHRLVAGIIAAQAASRTAGVETDLPANVVPDLSTMAALVEVLLGGPDWPAAVATLGGAFHPALATREGFLP